MDIVILYRDDSVIVVDKPHGLLSVPGKGPDKQDCVASRVVGIEADAKIVHRLDCHTSGVMLMAIGKANQAALSAQFHDRKTDKEYIAVVSGQVQEESGEIDQPLRCDIEARPRQIIDHVHGKSAVTMWSRLCVEDSNTRLKLIPITGRSHQLRVHCQYLGYPIVGDRLYGGECSLGEPRMKLHAEKLSFDHPRTGERLTVESSCPF